MCRHEHYGRRQRRHRRGRSWWDSIVAEIDIGRGPKGRRGRRSMFGKGDMKFVILRLIADKPMHGYDVMKALEEECGGWYKASPGSVYPTLQMLEDQGLLSVQETDGKKVYTITPEGEDYLEEHEEQVDDIFDRFTGFTDEFAADMKDLSQSFSKLARETFESTFKWSEDAGIFDEVHEIIEDARSKVEEVKARAREAAREARRKRREARSSASETADATSGPEDKSGQQPADEHPTD